MQGFRRKLQQSPFGMNGIGGKMKEFFAAMLQDSAVGKIGRCFGKEKSQSLVYGLAGSQKHAVFAACIAKTGGRWLL